MEVLHDVQLAARSQLAQAVHVSHHSPVQDTARCRIPPLRDTCMISSEPQQDRLEQPHSGASNSCITPCNTPPRRHCLSSSGLHHPGDLTRKSHSAGTSLIKTLLPYLPLSN